VLSGSNQEIAFVEDEEVEQDTHEVGTGREVGGAAAVGGIAGLVIGGPLLGIVGAGAGAVVATTKGKAGDVMRSSGSVAANAGSRLKGLSKQHNLPEKTSKGMKASGARARKFDEKHHVVDKLKAAGAGVRKFDQKHRVSGKTSKGIVKGCNWISKKLQDKPSTTSTRNGVMT
jgi:hypothetical protein